MTITMKILDVAHTRSLLHKEAFSKARGAIYLCQRLVERGTIKPEEIEPGPAGGTDE
jgi:hypothetical protein